MCNTCFLTEVYDLTKTDWVEIDIPVVTEAALMEFFAEIRRILPMMTFYMGYRDTDMCLGSDKMATEMNLVQLSQALKPSLKEIKSPLFGLDQNPSLDYLLITYRKNMIDDVMIQRDIKTSFSS